MSMHNPLKWTLQGRISDRILDCSGGVYVLVFCAGVKRVIYVGTTNCFARRIEQHYKAYISGKRAVWRQNKGQDIYDLMSYKGEGNMFSYYAHLARNDFLWATTNLDLDTVKNDLNEKDSFIHGWDSYVKHYYIPNIEVWTCTLSNTNNDRLVLESQIQRVFRKNYKIGTHISKLENSMSWLGKVECLGDVFSKRFSFETVPSLGADDRYLFNHLNEKTVIQYKKNTLVRRRTEPKVDCGAIEGGWTNKEDMILYFLCTNGYQIEDIAINYLNRSASEVSKRVHYLSKHELYRDISKA